jgi:hypothetical protein
MEQSFKNAFSMPGRGVDFMNETQWGLQLVDICVLSAS